MELTSQLWALALLHYKYESESICVIVKSAIGFLFTQEKSQEGDNQVEFCSCDMEKKERYVIWNISTH